MEISAEIREQVIDEEHLRLLAIGHYIAGGLHILFSSFFIIHFVLMTLLASNPDFMSHAPSAEAQPPVALFQVMAWVFGCIVLLGWTFGALTIWSGRCIRARKRRIFSMVMAGFNILAIPLGTILGISALMVLARPNVKLMYGEWIP